MARCKGKSTKKARAGRKKALLERLAPYSLAAAAAMAAGEADGGIIDSGPINEAFGVGVGYVLMMEPSHPEVGFMGRQGSTGMSGTATSFGLQGFYSGGAPGMGGMGTVTSFDAGFLAHVRTPGSAEALTPGDLVGPSSNTPDGSLAMFYRRGVGGMGGTTAAIGDWGADGDLKPFGFSFRSEETGNTFYGWADVQRVSFGDWRLRRWAYDDSGAPIEVQEFSTPIPEPSTLGLLCLGAAGLIALRRRKRKPGEAD